MRYVVDIDGTICSITNGDYEESVPYNHAIDKINRLYDDGHTVVYFTARGMGRTNGSATEAEAMFRMITEQQLQSWGCKYNELILGKPSGDVYIDDKGVNSEHFF